MQACLAPVRRVAEATGRGVVWVALWAGAAERPTYIMQMAQWLTADSGGSFRQNGPGPFRMEWRM